MSRRGNCHDNAVAESFFQLLKRERIKKRIYSTRQDARADIFYYIEMFYNVKRKHGSNNLLSPVNFENQYQNNWEMAKVLVAIHSESLLVWQDQAIVTLQQHLIYIFSKLPSFIHHPHRLFKLNHNRIGIKEIRIFAIKRGTV